MTTARNEDEIITRVLSDLVDTEEIDDLKSVKIGTFVSSAELVSAEAELVSSELAANSSESAEIINSSTASSSPVLILSETELVLYTSSLDSKVKLDQELSEKERVSQAIKEFVKEKVEMEEKIAAQVLMQNGSDVLPSTELVDGNESPLSAFVVVNPDDLLHQDLAGATSVQKLQSEEISPLPAFVVVNPDDSLDLAGVQKSQSAFVVVNPDDSLHQDLAGDATSIQKSQSEESIAALALDLALGSDNTSAVVEVVVEEARIDDAVEEAVIDKVVAGSEDLTEGAVVDKVVADSEDAIEDKVAESVMDASKEILEEDGVSETVEAVEEEVAAEEMVAPEPEKKEKAVPVQIVKDLIKESTLDRRLSTSSQQFTPSSSRVSSSPAIPLSSVTTSVGRKNPILDELLFTLNLAAENDSSLTVIEIKDFLLSDVHILALAESLKTNTFITSLKLVNCGIKTAPAQALAKGVALNTSLSLLDLQANMIGPQAMRQFALALNTNCTLRVLNLVHQKSITGAVGMDAEEKFAEVLARNEVLIKLGLQFRSTHYRDRCDRGITKNKEIARKIRLAQLAKEK